MTNNDYYDPVGSSSSGEGANGGRRRVLQSNESDSGFSHIVSGVPFEFYVAILDF